MNVDGRPEQGSGNENLEPLVSVLVPSYNHERYVIECLESERSHHKRLELIVSDDCSSDKTYELAQGWVQDHAVRFERAIAIRQPDNLGIVKNIQFLFNNSRGSYLCCIAYDDLMIDSGISERLTTLQGYPSIDGVFGNVQVIDESGSVIRELYIPYIMVKQMTSNRLLLWTIIVCWHVAGPGLMLRRRALLANGGLGVLPENLFGEDRYIYVRLASQNKLMFINAVVAKYRAVQSSASRTSWRQLDIIKYMIESDVHNRELVRG